MAELDELARIQQAHHRRLLGLQGAAGDLAGEAWDTFAGLDRAAAAQFSAAAGVLVDEVRTQTSTIAVAYMGANDRLGGFPASGLVPELPTIRNGIPSPEIYHRSIVEARTRISRGATFDQAMASGRSRAVNTARTDVILTNRAAIDAGGDARPWVAGYRRVLTGQSCAFCATASTQRYKRAGLLPLHPVCDCDVAEILGDTDPGRIINRELLDALKDTPGQPDYWNGPYLVDEKGVIRYRKLEPITGPDGKPVLDANGNPRKRAVPGEPVKPEIVDHGELGPTLTDRHHASTLPDDLPDDVSRIIDRETPEPAPARPRRTKAAETDPAVLAEARRRNLTPARVIELREEKAQRRFLEDSARREAAKSLTRDSADVIRVADKYGIDPDEVLTARHRLADVRAVAREEAAKIQAEAMRELERLGTVRVKSPPRKGATSGAGTELRRGEWDWLEQVSDREKARLSREWYGGTQGPDQFAATMGEALGRNVDVDAAMARWLELNRRSEAAGSLRRGKIPSADAYSGQIDPQDLIGSLADDGFDAARLFGDELDAAGHIAAVERELVERDALRYLGDAVNPTEGPSPYRMTFDSWQGEVSDLEFVTRAGTATPEQLRRLAELVPEALDAPGISYEELHARIVATARKAGETADEPIRFAETKIIPGQGDLFGAADEALEAVDELPTPGRIMPGPDTSPLRDRIAFDPRAEARYGPTLDRLADLVGAPDDALPVMEVKFGGKRATKGGHFAPEGKRPPKPRRGRGKSADQYRDEYSAWLRDRSWRTPEIVVFDRGIGDDVFAFLHEYGHRLDFLPDARSWASRNTTTPAVSALQDAAAQTTAYRDAYRNFSSISYVSYWRSNEEVWARAFSQWAAERLGGAELESLRAMQRAAPNFQWTDAEFATLRPLVEDVLRERGLIA